MELFDLAALDSVVRRVFEERGPLCLRDTSVIPYTDTKDFVFHEYHLGPDCRETLADEIEPIVSALVSQGFRASLRTALYEATLNAHEHGNQKDSSKTVCVGYRILDDRAECLVIDEGGTLDPHFAPYVLWNRSSASEQYIDFYTFAGKQRSGRNLGTGTFLMHSSVNDVAYFKSETGGLVVRLTVQR